MPIIDSEDSKSKGEADETRNVQHRKTLLPGMAVCARALFGQGSRRGPSPWLGLVVVLLADTGCRGTAARASEPFEQSVSGFSSGASMALFHLIAFSNFTLGAGVVGASPYGCNVVPDSQYACSGMKINSSVVDNNIPWDKFLGMCRTYLGERAARGAVDPLSNLRDRPVYLFSGINDTIVFQNVMLAVRSQFEALGAPVRSVFDMHAEHAWVVDYTTCAVPGGNVNMSACCGPKGKTECPLPPNEAPLSRYGCCGTCIDGTGGDKPFWRPPINNCGHDMSGAVLRWIYGPNSISPRSSVSQPVRSENLMPVNQSRYMPPGWTVDAAALDATGFVYAPAACRKRTDPSGHPPCRVHIDYHACGGNFRAVSTSYMLQTGLAAYAEANNFVLVFPQTSEAGVAGAGCWDWFGGISPDFDTHTGVQLRMVQAMVADLPNLLGWW